MARLARFALYVVEVQVGALVERVEVETTAEVLAVKAAEYQTGGTALRVSRWREVKGRCSRPHCRAVIFTDAKWWTATGGGLVCEDCP